MKSPWLIAALLVTSAGLIGWLTRPTGPALTDKAKESRRHPAPPADLQTANRHVGQNIADAQLQRMDGQELSVRELTSGKPLVLVFFSHDCDCSLEFARYFAAAMEKSKDRAGWYFVFPDNMEQITGFHAKSGLPLPSLRDPGAALSGRLGISKSGPFVLVDPQGTVSAIWPGVSLNGLEDLFSRLGLPSPPTNQLSGIPQSPTAGCPLNL